MVRGNRCNVMTTVLSLLDDTNHKQGCVSQDPVYGLMAVGSNTDGLVTHSSQAGVRCEATGQSDATGQSEATWQSMTQPQAVSCNVMTGAAGARSCVSRRQSRCEAQYRRPGHTHKQRRCVWSNIDGLVTNTSKAEVCVRQQGSRAQYRRPGHKHKQSRCEV